MAELYNPYADAQLYAEQQADFTEDLSYWLDLAKAANGPVLELGSGTGRVSHYLAQNGIDISGIDLDPAMVDYAQAQAQAKGLAVQFQLANMVNFQLNKQFSLIILPYNSICHLVQEADFKACMAAVQSHLLPNGSFVPSIFTPLGRFFDRDPQALHAVAHFWSESRHEDMEVFESNCYDPISQINDVRWFYQGDNEDSDMHEVHYRLRVYYPQELALHLRNSAWSIQAIHGDWQANEASATSLSLSYVCQKALA